MRMKQTAALMLKLLNGFSVQLVYDDIIELTIRARLTVTDASEALGPWPSAESLPGVCE